MYFSKPMKQTIRIIIVTCFLAVCCLIVFAQKNRNKNLGREELESQRMNILAEIKQTQEKLTLLQKDKTVSVQQLLVLQNKLDARKELIGNINKEINYLDNNIVSATNDVKKLNANLINLKKQYAELIRFSYKQRVSQSLLMFFFSSKNFNDAIRRYQYIKQYKEYRKHQAQEITYTSKELNAQLGTLSEQKKQKDAILQVQKQQELEIAHETNIKNAAVLQIKGKEQDLAKQLESKKKIATDLNNAIASAIRREIELARKKAEFERQQRAKQAALEAKQKAKEEALARAKVLEDERLRLVDQNKNINALKKNGTKLISKNGKAGQPTAKTIANNTPTSLPKLKDKSSDGNVAKTTITAPKPTTLKPVEVPAKPTNTGNNAYTNDLSNNVRQLSVSFENNKGYLPNPVSGGYICERFGKVKHPLYNVYTENFGVDIRTSKGAIAKSIFAGEVSSVFTLPGTGTNILVNHGTYFTVYSKLENVTVVKGQQIGARQSLGTVRTNEEGNAQVHLEIWKVNPNGSPVKLNPEQWIAH
jgi:murein hydrolase activator